MKLAILKTGLFPDTETVETALASLDADTEMAMFDLTLMSDEAAFDEVAEALVAADRIVTL